jgi:hypothetical protein
MRYFCYFFLTPPILLCTQVSYFDQPMHIQKCLPFILAILSCSSFARGHGEGFVQGNSDGETYLYTTETIKNNEKILIQYPAKNGDIECCKTTSPIGKLASQTDVTDELNGSDVHVYKLEHQYVKSFIGIAVFGTTGSVRQSSSGLNIKYGQTFARTCLSQEGIHLLATKRGDLKTHLYLPLGYDVAPTCDIPAK